MNRLPDDVRTAEGGNEALVVAVLRERALAGEFGGKGSAGRQGHRDEDNAKTQHGLLLQNPVD